MTPDLARRLIEATLFTTSEPLEARVLQALVGDATDLATLLDELRQDYAGRGVHLEQSGTRFAFRTAPDLASLLTLEREEARRLSKAALETLAIIAYHQPATRADIEALRGVAVARGTLDVLLAQGWIAPRGRRDTPGRPVEWVTTAPFLDHFGLASLEALPAVQELRAAGLLEGSVAQVTAVFEDPFLPEEEEEDEEEAREAEAELRPDLVDQTRGIERIQQ